MVLSYKWTLSQYKETNRALEIVHWLNSEGLVNNVDYVWSVNPATETTDFKFTEGKEMYTTLISLKFL